MAPPSVATQRTGLALSQRFGVFLVLLSVVKHKNIQGEEIHAVSFQLLTPPARRGNLSSNNILLNAERIHTGQISSPHSYVSIGDDMYAATASGLVVNVASCRPTVIANLRPRICRSLQECGHLVSIRLTKDNLLMVLDAYRGVYEVHPVTGVIRHLYDSRTFVNGRPTVYLNDFVIMTDGTIIMSDSSPRFGYDHEFWIRFEGKSDGRLIGFSPINGQSKEILSGLAYPTGLEITHSKEALLVSEASRARILRLELNKAKFFQRSYVNINLPGMPEHIRKSGRGTYWVGLSYPRYRGETSFLDQYSSKPASKNFMATTMKRSSCRVNTAATEEEDDKQTRTMNEIRFMYRSKGLAVELDEVGRILHSIHDPYGEKVGEVLEVTEYSGVLYVGTRTQQATVRVVGSPNELTVDSLVQVLRGRCKVSEDKVHATKESIEQQLNGNKTKEQTKSTATVQQYTSPVHQTTASNSISFKTKKPKQVINFKVLSQNLFKLHRTLINATVNTKKQSQTLPQVAHQGVTSNPQEAQFPTQKELILQHQITTALNNLQINTQYSYNTPAPIEDPFLPPQSSQNAIPPQNAAELSAFHAPQNNINSSNEPHLKHSFQGGQLTSHVIFTHKEQELLTGYLTGNHRHEKPYSSLPSEPSKLQTSKQTNENISQTISFNKPTVQPATELPQQLHIVTPRSAVDTVTQQNLPPETTDLGGFMGFLGNSAAQNGELLNGKDQTTKLDPYSFSVPDPDLYGQIEPALGTNLGSSSQTNQFLPGMESVVHFEEITLPKDQTPSKVEQMLVNQSQAIPSQIIAQEPTHSLKAGSLKRPDMNVQDVSIKDATDIQNMQMFHPTDRPEQSAQFQNQAEAKTLPSFSEKAPQMNQEFQQLQGIHLNHQPKETYAAVRSNQLPNGRQNEAQQNAQYMNTFEPGRPSFFQSGSALIDMSQNTHFSSSTQIESFDPGAPLHQGTAGNIYDHSANEYPTARNNNTDIVNQFMISGAARILNYPGLKNGHKIFQISKRDKNRNVWLLAKNKEKSGMSKQQTDAKTLGHSKQPS